MGRLIDVFESENMDKHEIVDTLSFAVRVDVIGKAANLFEPGGEMFFNVYGNECFDIVHEIDGESVIGDPLRYKSDGDFFGGLRNYTADKGKFHDTLAKRYILRWEAGKYVEGKAVSGLGKV